MLSVETKLVNSKEYKWRRFFAISAFIVFCVGPILIGRRTYPGLIEEYNIHLFFDDPDTLKRWIAVLVVISFVATFYFGLGKHDKGLFRLKEQSLRIGKSVFPMEDMQYLKFIINSPGIFGFRNFRSGFDNWVEFSVEGKVMKYEFYLKDFAMEDSLILLIGDIKATHSIPIMVEVKAGKPKESLFESWFGHG